MADEIRRDEQSRNVPPRPEDRPGLEGAPPQPEDRPERGGSPLGTDPQEASPLPGDPREAQEPQEPRTTHIGTSGREDGEVEDEESRRMETRDREADEEDDGSRDKGVMDQLKEAWDRMLGKE